MYMRHEQIKMEHYLSLSPIYWQICMKTIINGIFKST